MSLTTVLVGKFPQEYTEEQIMSIAKSVGPVVEVKLMFDDMTGRLKGFAHIKYHDEETVRLAVRNLNYMPLANNRFLRCVVTDDISTDGQLPTLPLGTQIAMNQQADRVAMDVVAAMDQTTGLKFLGDLKAMAQENPELAAVLFERYPQLALATIEASLKLGATNPDIVNLVRQLGPREIVELSPDQIHLLRQVAEMSDEDFTELGEQAEVMRQLRDDVNQGKFGDLLAR